MSQIFTIRKSSEGLYKEKGSKFISYLFPISSEEDAKNHMRSIKEQHSKARHHCYAIRLGANGEFERSNDDGEPNGSAGLPILNQLNSAQLTNVLLIVVRYFGGSKLGLSGLIRAYKESSKDVIENAKLVLFEEIFRIDLTFPITSVGEVERVIRSENCKLENADYGDKCQFKITCKFGEEERLIHVLKRIKNVRIIES